MAAKLPYYNRYPKDYLTDENVENMTLEEEGAYNRLMDHCWIGGSIPDEVPRLAKLCRATPEHMAELWPAIAPCFDPGDPGRLIHPRLAIERAKIADTARALSEAGHKGNEKRWGRKPAKRKVDRPRRQAIATRSQDSIARRSQSESDLESEPDLDQEQNLEQDQRLAAGSAAVVPGIALELVPEGTNGHTPTPGHVAQALVARCCEVHAEAGVEVTKRDRGQWAGIARRLALERSFDQVAFAVAGMDSGGGKLWRFSRENPERVPWNLFQLEQFFTLAVAAGRNRVEGPQRAHDDFDERVRRRAEGLR